MTLPVVDVPGKHKLEIIRGDTFGPRRMRWREVSGGPGVRLFDDPNVTARAQIRDGDGDGALLATFTVTIEDPEIVAPIAISAAFLANGVVQAAGANFVSSGVKPNDRVIVSGSSSNDTTEALVVSVDSEDQITTDQVFTAEPAAGTVAIAADGWFSIALDSTTTAALSFDAAVWDLEFSDAGTTPATRRTPLRGSVVLLRDASRD